MNEIDTLRALQGAIATRLAEIDPQRTLPPPPPPPSPGAADDADPLPPVPDGWGAPSTDLSVVRQQYVDAACRAAEMSTAYGQAFSDWRSLLPEPTTVDAMFITAHLALGRVVADVARNDKATTPCDDCKWVIGDDTARLVLAYSDALVAQGVAVSEFVSWAVRTLASAASNGDPTAIRIVHNLNAADLIDLFDQLR